MEEKTNAEILIVEHRLEQKRKILRSVNLKKLPDGGAKIQNQIEELERVLNDLTIKESEENKETSESNVRDIANKSNHIGNTQGKEKATTQCLNKITTRKDLPDTQCPEMKAIKNFPTVNASSSKQIQTAENHGCEYYTNSTTKSRAVANSQQLDNASMLNDKSSQMSTNMLASRTNYLPEKTKSSSFGNNSKVLNIPDSTRTSKNSRVSFVNSDKIAPSIKSQSKNEISVDIVKTQEDFLSFRDLSAKTSKKHIETLPKSPAFSQWRGQPELQRKIKLTDAKELIENSKKASGFCDQIGTCNKSVNLQEKNMKQLLSCLQICPIDIEETAPVGLETDLMLHQKTALAWLLWRETQVPSGGVFADDMGLGKTLSMIAMILKQKESSSYVNISDENAKNIKGTLIVGVTSIIHQWESEIVRHCKHNALRVLIHHGKNRDHNFKNILRFDVVITTYSLVMHEYKALRTQNKSSVLFEANWDRVILDEAHTIKNYKSQTAEAVFSLKAGRRWAVTGTPIHNNLKDMFALLKFLRCEPFDNYNIWKKLISDYSESSNKRRDMLVKSIMFRRCKNDVDKTGKPIVNLTKKNFSIHSLKLSESEKSVYLKLHSKVYDKLNRYFVKHKQSAALDKNSGTNLLVLLLRLQQCCNHTSLLGKEVEDDIVFDSFASLSEGMSTLCLDASDSNTSSMSDTELSFSSVDSEVSNKMFKSTKIKALFEELDKVLKLNQSDKCVIISQWVSMLDIVSIHLEELSIEYLVIKGSTKVEDREKAAQDFNYNANGPRVLLLSLKAGGVGLNLVGANHMFLLDLHWNPALETQACDRIYRVGQVKDVYIHKFICKDTIEEKILNFQKEKCHLANQVLSGTHKVVTTLSLDDFRSLFKM